MRDPRPIAAYAIGDRATVRRSFSDEDVRRFADLSGDFNELHVDDAASAGSRFGRRLVHGWLTASLITRLLGMELPGRGAIYMSQSVRFTAPVFIDDEVEATVEVAGVDLARKRLTLTTTCRRVADGAVVVSGEALVMVDV